jgi:hypothetical protein
MSYEENEIFWQQLRQRLTRTHEKLEERAMDDNEEIRRAVTRGFYQQGFVLTQLMYCRPRPGRPAAPEAAELAVVQRDIESHEIETDRIYNL